MGWLLGDEEKMGKLTLCQKVREKSFYNYRGRDRWSQEDNSTVCYHIVNQQISIADELAKLAALKELGIVSEVEFTQLKQDLLKKMQG